MRTVLTALFFFACTVFAVGQNPFGTTTIDMESDDLTPLIVDTMMRCTLVPRHLQDQHDEFHSEDSCSQQDSGLPSCLAEHLVLLDVPQYKDIRTVVPIVDTLEKIFQVLYGNSIVRLLQSPAQHTGGGMFGFGSRDGGGFAPGRFVDMQQTIFMHNIHLPDV
ncbi:MAG: hypothetical protein KBC22_00455 [Candidatus Pacebacteria bacterium]|nr:hypothetical protein [Candidatus Paceibacterota bacterium]